MTGWRFMLSDVQTIATFSKPEDAHLLRMRLESAGIHAFIQDENMIQWDWLLSNAIGGARVQIADEDLLAAQDYLANDRGVDPVERGVDEG
jgi:Putative prokaryotic signal transducing protein